MLENVEEQVGQGILFGGGRGGGLEKEVLVMFQGWGNQRRKSWPSYSWARRGTEGHIFLVVKIYIDEKIKNAFYFRLFF